MNKITWKSKPSRRSPYCGSPPSLSSVLRCFGGLLFIAVALSCGGGGGVEGTAATGTPQEIISGKVIAGSSGAVTLICVDLNRNGRCDDSDPQTHSDVAGNYQLTATADASTATLIAEVPASQPRAGETGAGAGFYRMASPSPGYSSNITPFTTLVKLSGQSDFALAEDLTRNVLGLPAGFALDLKSAPAAGSFTQGAASAVASALQALGPALDLGATGNMTQVIAKLAPDFTSLPVLRITTKDGAPILSKETYVVASFTLTHPAAGPDAAALNGKIRGRGNTTWEKPKNPYKVQFTDDAAYARVTDFLGMKKNRNWALLADYYDRSLLRNKLALSLGASSVFSDGIKWTPSAQHVEVYLNDDYIGVYLLTEDIRIDPVRLDIKKMSTSPTAREIDGGYLVEVDFRLDCYNQDDINLQLLTPQGVPICIKTPDEAAITQDQLSFIKSLLVATEQDLYEQDDTGGINVVSFVDWYLIHELFRSVDAAFGSSVYMWKDTGAAANPRDRLLNMGPIWDFDRSAGNVNYSDGWKTAGCHVNHLGDFLGRSGWPNWLAKLSGHPPFVDLVVARWKQKRTALGTFINSGIDTFAARIDRAQERNFARWPWAQPDLVNYYPFSNHAEEVSFLKSYLNDRMAWLDQAYASAENFNSMCKQPWSGDFGPMPPP